MELDQVGTWPSVNLTKLWTWPNVNERPYMWYIFWKAQGQVPSLVKFTPGFNLKVHSMIKFTLGQVPNRVNFTIGSNTHLVIFPHGQVPSGSSSSWSTSLGRPAEPLHGSDIKCKRSDLWSKELRKYRRMKHGQHVDIFTRSPCEVRKLEQPWFHLGVAMSGRELR